MTERVPVAIGRVVARWRRWPALLVWLALAACTSQQELRKAELASLIAQLPGAYDNLQQVQADAAAGRAGAHAAQALIILKLRAPLVGDDVLYVRETAAEDPRRVTAERVWSLEVNARSEILATVARFEEPERWRGGAENPELFRALLLRDLHAIEGCDLLWQKSAPGFSGDTLGTGCRRGGAAGAAPQIQHWRLGGDELAISEAASGEDYYRFVRRSGAQ
jgi:hypothetical protein